MRKSDRVALVAALLAPCIAARAHAQEAQPTSTPATNELPPEEAKVDKPQGVVVPVSVMGGIRAGAALNPGKFANDSVGVNDVVAGVDVGLEVGALVFDHFYGGLTFGGTLFVSPGSTSKNLSGVLFGTELGYLTNAHGFGAFFGVGIGYRAFFVSDALGNANKFDSPDALFTVALHVRAGSLVRILPRVDLGLGAIDGNVHALVVIGISAWINDDITPKKRRHAE